MPEGVDRIGLERVLDDRVAVDTPTALLSGFDILVDGQPAATAQPTDRSATIRLAPGRHTVQVRTTHVLGPAATTAGVTVVADPIPPTFGRRPDLALRAGTVSSTAVPATLTWQAADTTALRSVALTTPATATFGPTTHSWPTTATPGRPTAWTMRASDWADNTSTAATTRTPVLLAETAAKRSGTWKRVNGSSYLGGKALTSTARNAALTWTFTGRSAALITSRGTWAGRLDVYVDGRKTTTIDLRASKNGHRQAVWTKTWNSAGKHTVKIVVAGTPTGRPRVTTDGIAYLK